MILSVPYKDFVLKSIYIYRRVTKTENQISIADAFIFWRHYYSAHISPKFGVLMSYFLFIYRFWIVSTLQYESFLTQVGTEHHVGLNYYAILCLWNMIINQSFFIFMTSFDEYSFHLLYEYHLSTLQTFLSQSLEEKNGLIEFQLIKICKFRW